MTSPSLPGYAYTLSLYDFHRIQWSALCPVYTHIIHITLKNPFILEDLWWWLFMINDDNVNMKLQERDRDVQGWALVCDTLLTRAASPGTVFQVASELFCKLFFKVSKHFPFSWGKATSPCSAPSYRSPTSPSQRRSSTQSPTSSSCGWAPKPPSSSSSQQTIDRSELHKIGSLFELKTLFSIGDTFKTSTSAQAVCVTNVWKLLLWDHYYGLQCVPCDISRQYSYQKICDFVSQISDK